MTGKDTSSGSMVCVRFCNSNIGVQIVSQRECYILFACYLGVISLATTSNKVNNGKIERKVNELINYKSSIFL